MLTFFRKIRKAFLDSGSTGKYLLYAVGEILLVVIGILIALQINNWNQSAQNKTLERIYLTNLLEELDGQIDQIELQASHDSVTKQKLERALQVLNESEIEVSALDSALTETGRRTFIKINSVFEDLKYSGNFSLLSNVPTRNELILYYQYLDYVVSVIANNNHQWIDGLRNFLLDYPVQDVARVSSEMHWPWGNYSYTFKMIPFDNGNELIKRQLEQNDLLRLSLHNHIITSGEHLGLHEAALKDLKDRTEILKLRLRSDLEAF
jgi:hypothetical protein